MVKSSTFSLLSVEEQRILYVISGYPRARIEFSKPGYLVLGRELLLCYAIGGPGSSASRFVRSSFFDEVLIRVIKDISSNV